MNPSSNALRKVVRKGLRIQSILSKSILAGLAIVPLMKSPVEAATTIYSDRPSFEASLSALVVDNYSNPGYVFQQSNLAMSSVLGETDYTSTGFLGFVPDEINIVTDLFVGTVDYFYCAGCNGSFILSFTTTSVGTQDGVFGVGFEFFNRGVPLYNAFVTFGNGSPQNIPLPSAHFPPQYTFFGITSDLSVKSIAFGLPNGQATKEGFFGIDNLTIGKPVPAPLPLLGVGAAFGFSRKLRKRIKNALPVASTIA